MCNFGDAKNWTGLVDVAYIDLSAGATHNVKISENFFATSIAVSYVSGTSRYITYANELDTNGKIQIFYNIV